MAQYRLEVQTIQRSAGRSAVAAAAYRSGERLIDERLANERRGRMLGLADGEVDRGKIGRRHDAMKQAAQTLKGIGLKFGQIGIHSANARKSVIIRLEPSVTKSNTGAILGLLSGATTWGLVWYPLRLLEQAGLGGPASSLAIFAIAFLLGLPFTWRGLAEFRAGTGLLLGIGLAAGWANLAYVLGVIQGEVVRVLLLFYLAPLWTVLLSRLLLNERLASTGYGVVGLSLAGALIMLWHPDTGMPLPKNSAEWLGLSAGMAFACSNVLSRKAHALSVPAKSLSVWGGVVAVALMVMLAQPSDGDKALAAARAAGERGYECVLLKTLGYIARLEGDYPRAASLLEEALTIGREIGFAFGAAEALAYLGETARDRGEDAHAAELLTQGLTAFREEAVRHGRR